MKKLLYLALIWCAITAVGVGQGTGPVTVREADGSPRVNGVREIIVSNGALTVSGKRATVTTGGGTVTSVSVVTANGVSGSVATATTTPAITLTLGAITPTTVTASGMIDADSYSLQGSQFITASGSVLNLGQVGGYGTSVLTSTIRLGGATDMIFRRSAAANLAFGAADANPPVAQTLSVQNATGTDIAGANWTLASSRGTGIGPGGSIIFQTAPLGGTGSSQNALVTALTIDSKAHVIYGGTVPGIGGSCGTGPSIVGTDMAGKVTAGTVAPTSCTITFNKTWTNAPACIGINETTSNLLRSTSTVSTLILTGTMVASDVLAYVCSGY